MTFRDAIAYIAPDGASEPASSVDDGAMVRRDAPRIVTNSYTLPPLTTSPSTSKKVACIVSNGGMGVVVPASTKLNVNSAARITVGVPSAQLAEAASRGDSDAHIEGRTPKPRQA